MEFQGKRTGQQKCRKRVSSVGVYLPYQLSIHSTIETERQVQQRMVGVIEHLAITIGGAFLQLESCG